MELSPLTQQLYMRILKYSFTAHHVPGKELIDSDTLSGAPVKQPFLADLQNEKDIDAHMHLIVKNLYASQEMLATLRHKIQKDKVLEMR